MRAAHNGVKSLNEAQLRVLNRIAALMRESFTGHVELELGQGGVRDFRESRRWKPGDLEPPEDRNY